ncbi:MAG: hypothetical protein MI810_02010 [Flavobacteriales bacterium]|nr:hypothetical protein [Flavobacteriales bacterium]
MLLKKFNYSLLVCFIGLCACKASPSKPKEDVVEDSILTVDTNKIEAQIIDQFTVKTDIDSISFQAGSIACKLNLNSDEYLDYFVIVDNMGGPIGALFFDGKTGEEFDFFNDYDVIVSRPGVNIEYQIVDVNCKDYQQELLIKTGGGGTIGNYYNCEILRYDSPTNTMKIIFSETISAFEWEDDLINEKQLEVNHIDILYAHESCFSTIVVHEGKLVNQDDRYSADIEILDTLKKDVYQFKIDQNIFEKSH